MSRHVIYDHTPEDDDFVLSDIEYTKNTANFAFDKKRPEIDTEKVRIGNDEVALIDASTLSAEAGADASAVGAAICVIL